MNQLRPYAGPLPRLVKPVRLDPTGRSGPTRGQARSRSWVQTTHGFHVPAETDRDLVEQRILEQSMRLGSTGGVTGWAALRIWRAAFFDGIAPDGRTRQPVELVARGTLRPTSESISTRACLGPDPVGVVGGIRLVGPNRALVDEIIRRDDLREAVVAIDIACAAPVTSLARLTSYLQRRPRLGNSLVTAAIAHASERSLSPPETRMRIVWTLDAGWPAPLVNQPVYDADGFFIGMPDLLDPETGVEGEYDGAPHRDRRQHRSDVARYEAFRLHGLEPFTVVAGDSPRVQVARMEACRQRALARPATDRQWTLVPALPEPAPPTIEEVLRARGVPFA